MNIRTNTLKTWIAACCLLAGLSACEEKKADQHIEETKLTFAYLTDVHLNKDNYGNGNEGLRQALESAQHHGAEFVLFGGDNADTDALQNAETTADTLHARFKRIVDESKIPAHFTIGNHDRFYLYEGKKDTLGFKTFEKHYGKTYTSFTQKGVHFITLNSLFPSDSASYTVNKAQIEWLKADLEKTGKEMPVVVSIHVPMLSLYYPVVEGKMEAWDMIGNSKEIVDILAQYNTQLILQGHQHIYEQIQERNLWFITAGAVSAYWWGGAFMTTEEGFLLIKVDRNNKFTWEYVDYGWNIKK